MDIPAEPYFRADPKNMTLGSIVNGWYVEAAEVKPHPWDWLGPDAFYAVLGAHAREMFSWATDDVKEFWTTRNSWYKEDHIDIDWFLWGYRQSFKHRFCTALPTYKRIWG